MGDAVPVVKDLLKKGADINATCGRYGSTLQAALFSVNKMVVQLLLEKEHVSVPGG